MNQKQLTAFVSLAGTLRMPDTARELNTTQSHISKLLTSLEAELGVRLFERVGRRLVLNSQGEIFYSYALRAIRAMNEGRAALGNTPLHSGGALKGYRIGSERCMYTDAIGGTIDDGRK